MPVRKEKTMSRTTQIIEMTDRYGAHNYKPLPVVIERAEGVWMYDVEGRRYMDFLSAYSAVSHGHCHHKLVQVMREHAGRCAITSRAFHNDQLGPWLKELVEFCGMEMALPMNTGAEAIETAIKIARKWGYKIKGVPKGKAEIIVCADNFHGRTITVISFSTEPLYRDDFAPFTPGFIVIPYGDLNALRKAITPNTAAFLVEPIQGEAGVRVPPEGFLAGARKICTENRVLLMLDEIQTGLGRTGKKFCCEHENVLPDVLVLGKALGGGMVPISAVVSSDEVLGLFIPGEHGSTFGGNPLACAVSRAALRVLVDEDLIRNSESMGGYLKDALSKIKNPYIQEIRGKGLLLAVEFKREGKTARQYCEELMEQGILAKETHETSIRFAPPLVISKKEMDWAIERINKVLNL